MHKTDRRERVTRTFAEPGRNPAGVTIFRTFKNMYTHYSLPEGTYICMHSRYYNYEPPEVQKI